MPNLIGLPITFHGFSKNHDLYFHGSQTARTHILVGSYSPLTGTLVIVTTPKPFSGAYDILTRSIFIGFGYDMFQFNFEFMTHRGLPVVHISYNKQGPYSDIPDRCSIPTGKPNFNQCVSSAGPGTTYVSGSTPTPISTVLSSAATRTTSTLLRSTATDVISSPVTSSTVEAPQTTTSTTSTADVVSSPLTSSAVVAPPTTTSITTTSFQPTTITATSSTSTTTSRKPDATITERKH
ncbi:uncharacterized protein NDAI_0J01780 [Naumovozyma dairenensis CBS 421]|uniref:Hyphally-regulated cell wall protein N-terminal domain-containing protein n=1 Tax=Naumovozyma dairenensis (strain ATCC 10597 / BCRC 20456 / CBS 421 / NBRC 0211 / NRRL Y-12639) TaxID=1071378 RepID=G0WGZ2_NAUDC|nr:hypothetical protein NDAI_0J01780 [Naumovozyma dairenensis CBS 421]CCD27070.1 hypothetical protein NDAI_0J01780 [Naumovozyma dairenensis CBS 421]